MDDVAAFESDRQQTVDEKESPPERDSRGRFVPGNQAGKGHGRPPVRRRSAEIIRILHEELEEELRPVFRAQIRRAKTTGDPQAFKAIMGYAVGAPTQRVVNVEDEELVEQLEELWRGCRGDATASSDEA